MQHPKINLYHCGKIEIGFDSNGPIVSLAGVLHSQSENILIESMQLSLNHEKENSSHVFNSFAFKPEFLLSAHQNQNQNSNLGKNRGYEMARPFLLKTDTVEKFNVIFKDVEVSAQVDQILDSYYHKWNEVANRVGERRNFKPNEPDNTSHDDLISEFKRMDICVNSYTDLNHKCYWNQGKYNLELKLLTSRPEFNIVKSFHFQLSKHDAKHLKINCVTILDIPIAALLGKPLPYCDSIATHYL